ncbi:MAG: hypothetical protein A3J97_13515 [Spirochaetes bacterium RIFOXYC1_FULL_54_7]|nr:MAG: hypothetical protein A3J97_13515 [Spirochaetes bacterium RIFOXYC1_FULL_54_7]
MTVIPNDNRLQYARIMVSVHKYHWNLAWSAIVAIQLSSVSCSLLLDKPQTNPESIGPGARTLAEVYEALDSLPLQYPEQLYLPDPIGFGASADFPASGAAGDPALPIRLAVWRDADAEQPAWGLIPIRITAAIHGNEELGTELTLALLELACRDKPLELAGLELHVVPVANPYGYQYSTRGNYHGVDLNRNFSWAWGYESFQGDAPLDQPESRTLAEHAGTVPFALSLSLHTGAYRIVMPWDYLGTSDTRVTFLDPAIPPAFPYEDYLSLYSPAHTFLDARATLFAKQVEASFPAMGSFMVVQGFDWYFAGGTETDYLYMELGFPSYTVELSLYKYWKTRTGAERELMVEGHLKALLALLAESRQGIHGRIPGEPDLGIETRVNAVRLKDDSGGARLLAGPEPVLYTSFGLVSASDGSFHIPLGAGTYQLTVVRDGAVVYERQASVEPGVGTYLELSIPVL